MRDIDAGIARYVTALDNGRIARLVAWHESATGLAAVVRSGPEAVRACEAATGIRKSTIRRWAFAAAPAAYLCGIS